MKSSYYPQHQQKTEEKITYAAQLRLKQKLQAIEEKCGSSLQTQK